MSGFAQEIQQAFKKGSAAPVAETPVEVKQETASEPAAEMPGPKDGDTIELATGSKPVEAPVKKLEPTMEPIEEIVEKKTAPIKIAGKEFGSIDEAIQYAEQLEIASREEKAFAEGYEKAKEGTKEPEPPAKTLDDEVEEMLFENPKEAVKKLREGIQKEIFSAYEKMTAEQRQAQMIQQQREQTWNNFYQDNADLADSKDYIDFLLQKNWQTLGMKPADQALKELADLARKGLRLSKEASLPKTELQSKPAMMAGASTGATPQAQAPTDNEKIDFISQITKLRKRK